MFVASWFVTAIGWGPMVHETAETKNRHVRKAQSLRTARRKPAVVVWSALNKAVTSENTSLPEEN